MKKTVVNGVTVKSPYEEQWQDVTIHLVPLCPIKWFHKSCLRMESDPEGKWVCLLPVTNYLSTGFPFA